MPEDDIGRLTPREFAALMDRHEEANRRADLRTGIIASLLANIHRDEKRRSEPFSPADFMPSGAGRQEDRAQTHFRQVQKIHFDLTGQLIEPRRLVEDNGEDGLHQQDECQGDTE